jgi:uncharacterized protein YbaA (DUF1428 family)
MAYVDGFLLQVPTKNLTAYKKMSAKAGEIWMAHGALDYKECAGDDYNAEGMATTFPKAMKLKPGHTIVFSWATYPSKAEMPFDPKTMLYAGFDVIVDMAPNVAPKRAAKKRTLPKKKAAKKKAKR